MFAMPVPFEFDSGPPGTLASVPGPTGLRRIARRLRFVPARNPAVVRDSSRRRFRPMKVGHGSSLVPVVFVFTFLPSLFSPARTVIIKVDVVPATLVNNLINEKDPATGKSRLPWIDEVFVHNGTRISNFYVRGISL